MPEVMLAQTYLGAVHDLESHVQQCGQRTKRRKRNVTEGVCGIIEADKETGAPLAKRACFPRETMENLPPWSGFPTGNAAKVLWLVRATVRGWLVVTSLLRRALLAAGGCGTLVQRLA